MDSVLDYIKKSFELKNQGYFKPAIEMLYKALAIEPENIEILVQLGLLYKLLNNFQRAIYYVDKVLEINKNHLDALILLKDIYLAEDKFKDASLVADKIYEIQPNSENLAEKIKLLNKLGEFSSIISFENNDLSDEVLFEIASAYFKNKNTKKAIELLEKALEKNNKNEKTLFLLAKIYYENNNFDKSKETFLKLNKIKSTPEVLNYLGLFDLEEKDFMPAIEHFSKALKMDGRNAEYAYNLASAYFLDGWLDEALKFFNKAICLAPENINYHYSLAYLYYQKKMYDKANYEVDYIKTLDETHVMSKVLKAMIMAKKGDLINAKSSLEEIISKNENDDFALSALSDVYKELSQFDLAKIIIEKAIKLNPDSLNYLSELIELELVQKNYDKVEKMAKKAIKANEKYIYAYIALAKIALEKKDFDSVYENAQIIIELDPSTPEGYYYNALALFEQGDKIFAMESLKKSISLDPNNAALYIKMSEFYQDLNDMRNAYIWALEAEDIDDKSYQTKWLCAKIAATLHKEEDAVKYYSQSYRIASFDEDLVADYAKYLKSVGREKQASKLLKK